LSTSSDGANHAPRVGHVRALDTIRGIAVAMVLFHHIWGLGGAPNLRPKLLGVRLPLAPLLQGAGLGVDIFFVLSGYLLSLPWHRAEAGGTNPKLGTYLRRRLSRIVPPYYGVLLIVLLFMHPAVIPWGSIHTSGGIKRTVAHLLFAQQLFPISAGGYGALGSLWTLTIEMIFYLILPVMVLGFLKGRWRVSLPLSALASLAWMWFARHQFDFIISMARSSVGRYGVSDVVLRENWLVNQFPAFLFDFGLGICMARLAILGDRSNRAVRLVRDRLSGWILAPTGLAVLYFALYLNGTQRWSKLARYGDHWITSIGTALLILATMNSETVVARVFSLRVFTSLGTIGYSVFLWHMPVIYAVNAYPSLQSLEPRAHVIRLAELVLPLTLMLSVPYYFLVERPFTSLKRSTSPARHQ
jgi:peptidoglycan/LPS O-acetylase OafA/YrhL